MCFSDILTVNASRASVPLLMATDPAYQEAAIKTEQAAQAPQTAVKVERARKARTGARL